MDGARDPATRMSINALLNAAPVTTEVTDGIVVDNELEDVEYEHAKSDVAEAGSNAENADAMDEDGQGGNEDADNEEGMNEDPGGGGEEGEDDEGGDEEAEGEEVEGEDSGNESEQTDLDTRIARRIELSRSEISSAALPLRNALVKSFPALDGAPFSPYQNGHVISHGVVDPADDMNSLEPLPVPLSPNEAESYSRMLAELDDELAINWFERAEHPWLRIDAMIVLRWAGEESEQHDEHLGWLDKAKALAAESPDNLQMQKRVRLMEWARWKTEQESHMEEEAVDRLRDLAKGGGVGGWINEYGKWHPGKNPRERHDEEDQAAEQPPVSSPGGGSRWAFR